MTDFADGYGSLRCPTEEEIKFTPSPTLLERQQQEQCSYSLRITAVIGFAIVCTMVAFAGISKFDKIFPFSTFATSSPPEWGGFDPTSSTRSNTLATSATMPPSSAPDGTSKTSMYTQVFPTKSPTSNEVTQSAPKVVISSTPGIELVDQLPTRYPTAVAPSISSEYDQTNSNIPSFSAGFAAEDQNTVIDVNDPVDAFTIFQDPPTMYPTEAAPTMYPTINTPSFSPTVKPGLPTLYPTGAAPTEYPTDSSMLIHKTEYPTVEIEHQLKFTTKRDGYDYLPYFSQDPNPYLKYLVLDGYNGVVEPEANMYMYIFEAEEATGDSDEYYYMYKICEVGGDTESCTENAYDIPYYSSCTALTTNFTVSVYQYSSVTNERTTKSGEGTLLCMYVRREFRALTEVDLNKTMNAMWVMWELSEDEGISLYGDKFHNYARLLEYHYFNAAWQDADHIHEGNGFIAQHIKMDLIFQRSMQSIDKSVTLPYWDFTIENATGVPVWESPLFTADTFGSLNLPSDMVKGWTYMSDSIEAGGVADGRWQNFRAEENTKYPDLYSAYGYMRAPWNMNPSNMLTRFTSIDKWLPTCENHYTLTGYTLLSDFLFQVPYGAHASVHGVIGGVYGCDLFDDLLNRGYIIDEQARLNLCKNWIFYLKEFYRDDLIAPKSNCTALDENGEFSTAYEHQNCGYTCVPEMVNILYVQLQRSVLNSDYECVDVENMPQEGWLAWKEFICDGDGYKVFGGDHLESASPADPSFWPIHPTLERLLHARFMSGGYDTDEWPSDPINDYVCNKKTCFDDTQALTDDIRSAFSTWDSCCYGHYQDDQLLNAPDGDRYSGVGPTNREIFEWTNPTRSTYKMEYIYDGFTWDHCKDQGYDIEGLLEFLYYNVTPSATNESAVEVTSDKGWRTRL